MRKLGYILGILILGLFILVWCDSQKKTIEDKIEDYILDSCYFESDEDSCFLNLNKFVPVPWDTMAIFEEYTIPSEIEDTLKIHYKGSRIRMGDHRIIFVKNGKVVYEETLDRRSKRKGHLFRPFSFTHFDFKYPFNPFISTDSIYVIKRFESDLTQSYGKYMHSVVPLSKNRYFKPITKEEMAKEKLSETE
jgi:hypothetical protein